MSSAVMIAKTPRGFEPGYCVPLITDPRYPYCYELSVIGYPGFGVLESVRARIDDEEFSWSRTASTAQIRQAFPAAYRSKILVTGGQIELPDGTIVSTGRVFIGAKEQLNLFIATQDAPADGETFGFDEYGSALPAPTDEFGFEITAQDSRVRLRMREVPFLASLIVREVVTLVDTSWPSPIAPGALAIATPVASLGFTIVSAEPRVYQELSGVFENVAVDSVEITTDEEILGGEEEE